MTATVPLTSPPAPQLALSQGSIVTLPLASPLAPQLALSHRAPS